MHIGHILLIVLPILTVLIWGTVYVLQFRERIMLWYDRTFRD